MFRPLIAILCAALAGAVSVAPAAASPCFALAGFPALRAPDRAPALPASLDDSRATFTYITHSTYLIESAGGVRVATDYAGYFGDGQPPDVATMNFAHSSHWTAAPDPQIMHVLKGWDPIDGADHHLEVGDMVIRNVATDIRSWDGDHAIADGNSIFIFEVGDLCIGHLGHLHHEPTEDQYARIGRLDVVMAPVDGGYTLPLPTMIRVLKRLRASVVLPMHWFGQGNLRLFVQGMSDQFEITRLPVSGLTISAANLPSRPTVFAPLDY